jgi:hypothetical protein
LKVTEMVQLAPAFTVVPQVLVWEKSPLAVMLETVSDALPLFVKVTVSAALAVPTSWLVKSRFAGDKLAAWPPCTVRLKLLVAELTPLPLAVMVIVWLLTNVALLAAWSAMLPEPAVPG